MNWEIYEGEWRNDKANSKGVYRGASGESYEGEWVNETEDGFGKETWAEGNRYEATTGLEKDMGTENIIGQTGPGMWQWLGNKIPG